jgi:hypothetical protein
MKRILERQKLLPILIKKVSNSNCRADKNSFNLVLLRFLGSQILKKIDREEERLHSPPAVSTVIRPVIEMVMQEEISFISSPGHVS